MSRGGQLTVSVNDVGDCLQGSPRLIG
jgi:hypothetical protein